MLHVHWAKALAQLCQNDLVTNTNLPISYQYLPINVIQALQKVADLVVTNTHTEIFLPMTAEWS